MLLKSSGQGIGKKKPVAKKQVVDDEEDDLLDFPTSKKPKKVVEEPPKPKKKVKKPEPEPEEDEEESSDDSEQEEDAEEPATPKERKRRRTRAYNDPEEDFEDATPVEIDDDTEVELEDPEAEARERARQKGRDLINAVPKAPPVNAFGIAAFEAHPEDDIPPQTYTSEDIEEEIDEHGDPVPGKANQRRWDAIKKNDRQMQKPSLLQGDVITDKKVRSIVTAFGQRADVILRLLDDDGSTDGALTLMQRTMLQTLVDVLPTIERNVRKSNGARGTMALTQTISQMRELSTDIQALREKGQMGASIVESILRPAYLDIGVQIVVAFTDVEGQAKMRMSAEDYETFQNSLINVKKNLAAYVQQQYGEIRESVINKLS